MGKKQKKYQVILAIGAFFIFVFSAIYITFPLVFHLGDIATGLGDELVIAWIQNWVIHAVTTDPLSLFNANIYYPYNNSLAFSDLFLTSSVLSALPIKIIGEPIVAANFTFLSSLILLGFSTYLLSFYITKNFPSALLTGLLIIFSPAVLDKKIHLQILAIQWVPLAILFFLVFIKTQRSRFLLLSAVFFIIQTYNSFLPGYFIIFWCVVVYFYLWVYDNDRARKLIQRENIGIIVVSFLLLIPIIIPYYQVSREFHYVRDIRDTIHFALQPEDLLFPNEHTRLQNIFASLIPTNNYPSNAEFKYGYLGFIFTLLSIFSIIYSLKNFKRKNLFLNSFITVAFLGIILSFGPALHFNRQTIHYPFPIILPYALFYYLLPGFQGFRNSSRWEMLFILSMGVVIAMILTSMLKHRGLITKMILYGLLIVGIIAEYNFPMHFVKVPPVKDFPKAYSWLLTVPANTAIIELPIYNWNMWPYTQNELLRVYYSTSHFRKTVNGYSGFSPPPWQALVGDVLGNFPSPGTIETLKKMGISYIFIHKDEYDMLNKSGFTVNHHIIPKGDYIIQTISKEQSVRLEKEFSKTFIYSL